MVEYVVKQAKNLKDEQIHLILYSWRVEAWKNMSPVDFRVQFKGSEFHFLVDAGEIVSLCRLNFKFRFKIGEQVFEIPELVGLVSIVKSQGYGKKMLESLRENLRSRKLECISFCYKHNRGFYEKCGIKVLYGAAKYFREPMGDLWAVSDDDDVLDVNLSTQNLKALENLSEKNLAYLVP